MPLTKTYHLRFFVGKTEGVECAGCWKPLVTSSSICSHAISVLCVCVHVCVHCRSKELKTTPYPSNHDDFKMTSCEAYGTAVNCQ